VVEEEREGGREGRREGGRTLNADVGRHATIALELREILYR